MYLDLQHVQICGTAEHRTPPHVLYVGGPFLAYNAADDAFDF